VTLRVIKMISMEVIERSTFSYSFTIGSVEYDTVPQYWCQPWALSRILPCGPDV
jgi:hypothetical protein